jgi:hypothetical protein
MRDVLNVIASAFLALAAWTATANPSQAETGTVRVVFGAAGVVAGVGNGEGTLAFQGKTYPFKISGASFGATLEFWTPIDRDHCGPACQSTRVNKRRIYPQPSPKPLRSNCNAAGLGAQ